MTTVMFNKNKIDDFVKAVVKQRNKRKIDKFKYWDLLDACERLYGGEYYIIPYYNDDGIVSYVEIRKRRLTYLIPFYEGIKLIID